MAFYAFSKIIFVLYLDNSHNQLRDNFIISYDARGNKTEIAYYDSKGKLKDKSIHTYDEQGRETKSIFDGGGFQVINTYDNEGNLIQETYTPPLRKEVHSKDADGSEIVEYYDRSGVLTMKEKYIYAYDAAGNWVKETKLKWSRWADKVDNSELELEEVTYRTIIYY